MSEITPSPKLTDMDFLPKVPKEYQGLLPTNEDWQRLLASALPEENENE